MSYRLRLPSGVLQLRAAFRPVTSNLRKLGYPAADVFHSVTTNKYVSITAMHSCMNRLSDKYVHHHYYYAVIRL